MGAGQPGERRGGYRKSAGRPAGIKETRPRKPPSVKLALPSLPEGADRGATRSVVERLDVYADSVAAMLMAMILDDTTPADTRLEAIREFYDRSIGPKPKIVLTHTTGNAAGPAPSPRRFEFARSLPAPQVQDVPVLPSIAAVSESRT
jgi:hypothetical protein